MKHTYLSALLVLIALSGCQQQRQDAANALAGIDALEEISTAPEAPVIAQGARQYVVASHRLASRQELPPPNRLPREIIEHPQDYAREADEAVEAAQSHWLTLGLGSFSALLLLALGALRASGTGGPIVEVIAKLLEKPNGPHRKPQAPQQPSVNRDESDHA